MASISSCDVIFNSHMQNCKALLRIGFLMNTQ
uniref:Uncharacterized protein n=1 Tax=Anguilla anguilla TaxID=7936 RepID=A0A0E9QJR3_ANGAN